VILPFAAARDEEAARDVKDEDGPARLPVRAGEPLEHRPVEKPE
jgi:hypothetical protein